MPQSLIVGPAEALLGLTGTGEAGATVFVTSVFASGLGSIDVYKRQIQLEINRALYMDERRYERSSSFAKLAAEFDVLADRLAEIPIEELRPYRAAAE